MVAHAHCCSGPWGACPVRVAVGAGGGGSGAGVPVAPVPSRLPPPPPSAPSRLSAAASPGLAAPGPRRRLRLLAAPLPGGSGKSLPPGCHGDPRVPPCPVLRVPSPLSSLPPGSFATPGGVGGGSRGRPPLPKPPAPVGLGAGALRPGSLLPRGWPHCGPGGGGDTLLPLGRGAWAPFIRSR